ncbi:monocyte to macrophage differentiation factor 2a isoform X2 [Archocentrus centrarchus]|uniref:monocyte to macrophage differentiation factor 2a isoform X2 n=1 Tax=Archocentrus centrarchus TaxID=63155 RepID=UPI0011E9ED14|nr:monocyte to macrophage differentiation factor 2-like isoform X2 [Archocentrus centrarchus]
MDFKKTKFGKFMNCRVPASKRYQPTEYEHAANCATHGLWILPSMVGGSVLYFLSVDQWHRVAAWLYGSGLTGLFITSTLFHTAAWKISHLRQVEQRFHMCDRMAIYFFIAASYSPWLMLRELGPWACHMRWLIWIMACIGSVYVFFFHERWSVQVCVNWPWEVSSMGWAWSSLRVMASFHSPTRSGICLWQLGQAFITTPSGGTCTYLRHSCRHRGDWLLSPTLNVSIPTG